MIFNNDLETALSLMISMAASMRHNVKKKGMSRTEAINRMKNAVISQLDVSEENLPEEVSQFAEDKKKFDALEGRIIEEVLNVLMDSEEGQAYLETNFHEKVEEIFESWSDEIALEPNDEDDWWDDFVEKIFDEEV